MLLCQSCLTSGHDSSHAPIALKEAVLQAKDAINRCRPPAREQLDMITRALHDLDGRMHRVSKRINTLEQHIDADFGDIQERLERRKELLKAKVSDICGEKMRMLEEEKAKLEIMQRKYSSYLQFMDQSMKQSQHSKSEGDAQVLAAKIAASEPTKLNHGLPLPLEAEDLHFVLDKTTTTTLQSTGQLVSSAFSAAACYAKGSGLSLATVYDQASFIINLFDSNNRPYNEKLSHILIALAAESDTDPEVVGKVVAQRGNVVEAAYTPVYHGSCKLNVKVAGEAIMGSPFSVLVLPLLRFRGNFAHKISEGLYRPWGLTIMENGDLVVIDNNGYKAVHIFSPGGERQMDPFCSIGHMWGDSLKPKGVAVDSDDRIFIVDGADNRVLWLTAVESAELLWAKRDLNHCNLMTLLALVTTKLERNFMSVIEIMTES